MNKEDKIYQFTHREKKIKVFLPRFEIDKGTMKQIKHIAEHTVLENLRFMPDAHRGVGCCIGLTAKIQNKLVPRYVGVDIGCGISMHPFKIKLKRRKIPKIEEMIRYCIPMNQNGRGNNHKEIKLRDEDWKWLIESSQKQIDQLKEKKEEEFPDYPFPEITKEWINQMIIKVRGNPKNVLCSIGTLGGGNHYVEVNQDENENNYLTVHSGSRNIGLKVCIFHQKRIDNYCKFNYHEFRKRFKEIKRHIKVPEELEKAENSLNEVMRNELHPRYLENEELLDYLIDMIICQNIATLNRTMMLRSVIENLGLEFDPEKIIETRHNYIDFNRFILRKGSISADEGELCIISLNMRDGVLLCKGKGNPDWNYSSAHGCGRVLNREKASRLKLKEFIKEMEDVYSTSVRKETLDESPMAYRDVELIKECLKDSVEILKQLKPIINCKGW